MSWLPPPREPEAQERSPWNPPSLEGQSTEGLRYLVVDEIVGGAVGLSLCEWPWLDAQGRLHFSGHDASMLGAELGPFRDFLAEHRRPHGLAERPVRIGDVFAVRVKERALARLAASIDEKTRLEPRVAPEEWLESPLYDVSADAREAAKVAFYAAVAPVVAADEARPLQELSDAAIPDEDVTPDGAA
jgi:hypothetical protein